MQITTRIRRTLATLLLSAGLAYPACAAVCPKGIGGCIAPGRCFLFVDADGNSLCDYTSRSGSATGTSAAPAQPAAPAAPAQTATPATSSAPATTTAPVTTSPAQVNASTAVQPAPGTSSSVQGSSGTGLFDLLHGSALLAGAILFIVLTAGLYYGIRKGVLGIQIGKTGPALALASLVALGISLMASCILAAGDIPGTVFALVYATTGSMLTAYLWYSGVMSRRITTGLALLGTLAGFVFLAPIMPLEFGGFVNALTGASALTYGIIVIGSVIAFAIVLGRTFCGHICPVGSLQELAYAVPVKKINIRHTEILELIRLAVFVAAIVAGIYLVDVMALTGLFELFSFTLSAVLAIALGLVLLSVFLYRPVCRILCPFGVLFSVLAEFSLFRLRRTDACIHCRKCEKVCPTHSAGKDAPKRECYLCARCTAACPAGSALGYHGEPGPGETGVDEGIVRQ